MASSRKAWLRGLENPFVRTDVGRMLQQTRECQRGDFYGFAKVLVSTRAAKSIISFIHFFLFDLFPLSPTEMIGHDRAREI